MPEITELNLQDDQNQQSADQDVVGQERARGRAAGHQGGSGELAQSDSDFKGGAANAAQPGEQLGGGAGDGHDRSQDTSSSSKIVTP